MAEPSAERYKVQKAAVAYINTLPIEQSVKDDLEVRLSQIIAKVHDDATAAATAKAKAKGGPPAKSGTVETLAWVAVAYLVLK